MFILSSGKDQRNFGFRFRSNVIAAITIWSWSRAGPVMGRVGLSNKSCQNVQKKPKLSIMCNVSKIQIAGLWMKLAKKKC